MIFDEEIARLRRKRQGMLMICDLLSRQLVNSAKRKEYWKDRTGHARQNINGGAYREGDTYTIYLAHGTEYGEWLEKGTGIYGPTGRPIVPVQAKILSWVDTNGKRHFAKSVKGIKPMPILKDTLESNQEIVERTLLNYWNE